MFEDIFNTEEKLYACEAALELADFYEIDISACYEADGQSAPTEIEARKKFAQGLKNRVTKFVNKVKEFCVFIARKIREIFFKITKKETFYMDPVVYKTNLPILKNADKITEIAEKRLDVMNMTKDEGLEFLRSSLTEIESLQKANDKLIEERTTKKSEQYQVYNMYTKPNCAPISEMMKDIDSLSKRAKQYEADAREMDRLLPERNLGSGSWLMSRLIHAEIRAIRDKVVVASSFASAPTSMPKKDKNDN